VTNAESDLAAFLDSLPALKRKELEHGVSSFTHDEVNEWFAMIAANPAQDTAQSREYHHLVSRIPEKYKEYRKRKTQELKEHVRELTDYLLPIREGRPRLDDLAAEAAQLKGAGLSYARIASRLNLAHGTSFTHDAVRKLIKRFQSRQTNDPPDKTQS
jgi:hypothetical protein